MTEEQPRKKVNCYIINSTPRPICNVEFQQQPFYKSIYNLTKPVAIYCVTKIKHDLEQTKEHSLFDFKFKLPALVVRMINERKTSALLQIRFGREVPGMSKLSERLPEPIQISINSHKDIAKNSPIDYNAGIFLLLNNATNRISILWPHNKTPYYMVVNIVEPMTIEDLVKLVQFNNKLYSVTLNTKAKAMEILKNNITNSDVEFSDSPTLKLSLLCPITNLKLKLPARSLKCSHLQCFDLRSLISLNKIKPTWKCPVCNMCLLIDELVVDSFLLDIVNSVLIPENCFQIIVFQNGNWEPYIDLNDQSESDIEHSKITSFIEPKKENLDDQSESDIEHSKNSYFIEPKKENLDDQSESDIEHSKNSYFIEPKKENLDDQSKSDIEHSKNSYFIEPKKENLDDQSESDIEHLKHTPFIVPKKENLDDQSKSDIKRSRNRFFRAY